jgi:putative redox protein
MSVEVNVIYDGDLRCTATHAPSNRSLTTDAPLDNGGKGETFSPTDLVATALATCILTIMGLAAKRQGWNIAGTRVNVVKEMTSTGVRRIAALKTLVTLPSTAPLSAADRAQLERAADACPVKQSLHPDVKVTVKFIYPQQT